MPRPLRILAACAALALAAPPAAAQAPGLVRAVPVVFAPGATRAALEDHVEGRRSVLHRITAEAGQRLSLRLTSEHAAVQFNLYAPGTGPGDAALAVSGTTGPLVPNINRVDAPLTVSGAYAVSVYLHRAAARRGERAFYRLEVGQEGGTGPSVQGDFADGLQGGPDWWVVRLGGKARALRLWAGPSVKAEIIGRLEEGQALRNHGCRAAEGRRWCKVAVPGGAEGWASGASLREGAAPR